MLLALLHLWLDRGVEMSEARMRRIETGQTSLRSLDVEAMRR